ncbi:hypothetical protein DSS3P1_14 [Ruegeria phage DSS3-P1]|uniref:hypothetical protein n=1 Tax=Ruegeria phage DSS3-P1 TaxID=1555208 RepID=UPI0002357D58|nr:hypothetical protein DSS3P1_14 [Ruegeria phage DSS3-P1]YP_009997152.1 hypothetical protein JT311_gp18 [Ruegeria phage vB_RpoS-V16]YP_009997231.1 hypothetical protein JT312_gp14 [Ruegeria phage vB_RpoS-V18]YP_009997313.1 hypothetical protein JT313_gp14 [Ruegeria phage vB_RpoS-V11]YP_009997396.1 hypothetical protein JT314_gp15 [Ruegeria phage vB_RpoS-V7]AET42322.1 hypothetical protein SDSG_00057 [Ruegeria phage DSS3-P1]AIT13249.1 hypothetical protein DSS3P1_14 [Ruegeria phage DSS3-P1]AWY087
MSLGAKILEPRDNFPGEPFMVEVNGRHIKAEDRRHAESIVDALNTAHNLGKRAARHEVRTALGLRTWGGDVRCTDT